MPKTPKTQNLAHHQRKRHAGHHNQGKHYLKTYLPYLPLILFSLSTLLFATLSFQTKRHVLSAVTPITADGLLSGTNAARAKTSAAPLSIQPALAAAAQAKANDMVKRNYWSHITPDGQQPWSLIQQTNYPYSKAGENLAYGFKDNQEVINGWLRSQSHRNNMLDKVYRDVGFGIAESPNFNGHGVSTVIVALYGTPAGAILGQETVNQSQTIATGRKISQAEILTNQQMPWLTFAVGIISGIAITLVLIRHGWAVRHVIQKGERFVAHHFLFDATLISLVILCAVLSQTAGFIK